jgi:NADH-quinone oxidoreductase subunit C
MSQPPGTPGGEPPAVEGDGLPARPDEQPVAAPVVRMGMFGVQDTPDTSGYGLLQVHKQPPVSSEPPYGGYFDAIAQELGGALEADGLGFSDAIETAASSPSTCAASGSWRCPRSC